MHMHTWRQCSHFKPQHTLMSAYMSHTPPLTPHFHHFPQSTKCKGLGSGVQICHLTYFLFFVFSLQISAFAREAVHIHFKPPVKNESPAKRHPTGDLRFNSGFRDLCTQSTAVAHNGICEQILKSHAGLYRYSSSPLMMNPT